MTFAFRIIYAAHCSGTHHKLAMDALLLLKGVHSERWRDLFLKHAEKYVEGSKAPDKEFKDFSNHVLHVEDNFWGGADDKAYFWYEKLVSSLKNRDWENAAYNAGVLSHYYTDPIQPLHTAQSEAENNIHRAVEWSISKSYEQLKKIGRDKFGELRVTHDMEFDWLERLVRKGAVKARAHYETLVAEYDFRSGVKNPQAGLNDNCRNIIAELITYATIGFAGILDRAFEEARVVPPHSSLSVNSILAGLKMPVHWVVKKLEDRSERSLVKKMYQELESTGKVERYLPEDDKVVRELYRDEVLAPKQPGSLAEALANLKSMAKKMRDVEEVSVKREKAKRSLKADLSAKGVSKRETYLDVRDPVEKAPSIGKKTAARLEQQGIRTVVDLLNADPETLSKRLEVRYITPKVIDEWCDQARLVCQTPGLRGQDAQLLVGVGYNTLDKLAEAKARELLDKVTEFIATSKGQRILRSSAVPDMKEVCAWVAAAGETMSQKAA